MEHGAINQAAIPTVHPKLSVVSTQLGLLLTSLPLRSPAHLLHTVELCCVGVCVPDSKLCFRLFEPEVGIGGPEGWELEGHGIDGGVAQDWHLNCKGPDAWFILVNLRRSTPSSLLYARGIKFLLGLLCYVTTV